MDTRILTLLVIISVAGSLAELHVPFYRVRRNGLQESDMRADTEFIETPRAKRQSIFESSSTAESTTTPKDSTTASAPSTTPANTTPKKPNLPSKPKPPSPNRPGTSPPASKPSSPAPKPHTPAPKPSPPPYKPNPTTRVIPSRLAANPATLQTDPTTPEPGTSPAKATTTPKQSDTEEPDDPQSTTPKVGLGSRIDSEDPDQESVEEPLEVKKPKGKPQSKPVASPATNPATNPAPSVVDFGHPQNSYVPQFAFPNFSPDFSSPYNPYGDPTFNSIPGPNNYAWTGTSHGQGAAGSFASAGASSFGGGAGYGQAPKQPSLADRGAFVDNMPNTGNMPNYGYTPNSDWPNAGYAPNMGSAGGFGYSGVGTGAGFPFQDPSVFVFPGYNPEAFQRQMEEQFKQLQNQFQKQQQSLFETANRIGTDGYSGGMPGVHTAVSSIGLGPHGGYQAGAINPVAPGVQSRFGEEIPAPSGGSFGVFSSSSSKTVIGPDGKPISHKTSTTGVNDNGKITFRTVED
ncbi:uncharacterized protein LOC117219947 isoform X2 [Megalopta genalis]|uniref:uncharacterized protein LOC117219947 isoform X2 n=1 Tax=Megalopta genalis TaxID=115081 RepID=UPI003FCFB5DA